MYLLYCKPTTFRLTESVAISLIAHLGWITTVLIYHNRPTNAYYTYTLITEELRAAVFTYQDIAPPTIPLANSGDLIVFDR